MSTVYAAKQSRKDEFSNVSKVIMQERYFILLLGVFHSCREKQRKFGRRVGHEVEGTRKSSCVADYSWQEVEVFEMWLWQRMDRISWTERVTNERVLQMVG